ncbi:unnamed protein product [Lactuca virosa]|uniref:Uncharacterized protein n=1 Tax=Lactuca virosa TaxID=75947 RepID=A0AAU9M3K0_9ASTR|nr:unnamed protein product [Lactuca virosa]
MRFAEYFGRAFASVNASQFPWMKTLKEASVEKMIDIPLSHISEDVYRTSADWTWLSIKGVSRVQRRWFTKHLQNLSLPYLCKRGF